MTRFLEDHIDSVEQLEALILLCEEPGRAWTAADVGQRLKTTRGSVEIRLGELVKRGLLERVDEEFAYSLTGAPDRHVRELAFCFQTRRSAVIETIFAPERGFR